MRVWQGFVWILIIVGTLLSSGKKPAVASVEQLLTSAENLTIHGQSIYLETYFWRDFMPISPSNGKPLPATIFILPVDKSTPISGIDADMIWVIYEGEIWTQILKPINSYSTTATISKLERIARDGPQ